MAFYTTEAKISKDPVVGLMKQAAADDHPEKLAAIVGSAMDDNGKLIVPEAVIETAHELKPNMAYLPSSGLAGLADAIAKESFGRKVTEAFANQGVKCAGVACSGGTNAISVTLMACTDKEDQIICHNPHWPGYDSVTLSIARRPLVNFDILDQNTNFNFAGFEECIDKVAQEQSKITIMLNTPFDNPLGKDFGKEAWKQIGTILAKHNDKEILLILDTAYLDFGPGGKDYTRLSFLPELFATVNSKNLHVVLAATLSKSFAMYGARVGAAIILSQNEESVSNWVNTAGGVVRGTYSNAARFGEELAMTIINDAKKLAGVHDYQMKTVELIQKRNQFLSDALNNNPIELFELIKPDGGFFTSLRIKDKDLAPKLSEALIADHFYIPIVANEFIRIPTCGIKEEIIDKVVNKLSNIAANLVCKK